MPSGYLTAHHRYLGSHYGRVARALRSINQLKNDGVLDTLHRLASVGQNGFVFSLRPFISVRAVLSPAGAGQG